MTETVEVKKCCWVCAFFDKHICWKGQEIIKQPKLHVCEYFSLDIALEHEEECGEE